MKAVAAVLLVLCYLALSHGWKCKDVKRPSRPVRQIDAGHGSVVLRDSNHTPYFLSGSTWFKLGTKRLQHVSVGPAGIWGIYGRAVYKYVAGNFVQVYGLSMKQVDAGGSGQVAGTSGTNRASCLRSGFAESFRGVGTAGLKYLRNGMKYYSCSPKHGCWGLDSRNQVIHTQRIAPTTCRTSTWRIIKGLPAKVIEVGTDGSVFAVCKEGEVYQRTGFTIKRPYGTRWTKLSLCGTFTHVSYDLGVLWAVQTNGGVMRCTR